MKRKLQGLLAASFIIGVSISAQAQMKKGVVVYDMIMSTDSQDPQMQMGMQMMEGTTMTLTFDGDSYKSEMASPMMIQKVISDGDNALQLMEVAGMRIATPMTMDELKEKNEKERGGEDVDYEIEKTDETKEIEGYSCTKYLLTSEQGTTTMWVTEDIEVEAEGSQFSSEDIDGFALEVVSVSKRGDANMTVTLTATSIKEKIKDKDPFNMEVPKGYMVKSLDELSKMQGGMRGGN